MAAERETNEDMLWGISLLPVIKDALGIGGEVHSVSLHFEYGMYATATLDDGSGNKFERQLTIFGTNAVSEALGAPKGLNAITMDISWSDFAICSCRYFPIAGDMLELAKILASPAEVPF